MRDIIAKSIEALGVNNFAVNPDVNDKESFDNSYIEHNVQVQVSLEKGTPTITWDQVKAKSEELKVEYDAQAYARNRKAEYDALNQLELISDDTNNSTTTHIDAINAIKTKWPKDNSGPV